MLFSKNGLDDEISHRNIASSAVAAARAIVQSHPSHPITASEVLDASNGCCRSSASSMSRHVGLQRFVDEEHFHRDAVWAGEMKERFAVEQLMRTYTNVVKHFVRCTRQNGEASGSAIAAYSAVLKVIVEHEVLL
ncbi:GPI-anchored surface protein, putative [Bodo saltans]|uniref:GPI-anchored surface protein, putative n=1 Tax=Bodo saltans TaxID=75058 RepID=A0A0S4JQF0_BODSA|nr:GPI-anchored surface protein, putative [Bodo saltans]|eukprot:CUG91270.1 GPI-anchored surface protein, putative [Bodo saltans]